MEQGSTVINGPHQGGRIEARGGEQLFVHFQDRGAYGRLAHLNPIRSIDEGPENRKSFDGHGVGQPLAKHREPVIDENVLVAVPQTSDEFEIGINLAWQ